MGDDDTTPVIAFGGMAAAWFVMATVGEEDIGDPMGAVGINVALTIGISGSPRRVDIYKLIDRCKVYHKQMKMKHDWY
jgi:hypothetical protein